MRLAHPRPRVHWTLLVCLVLTEPGCRSKEAPAPLPVNQPASSLKSEAVSTAPKLIEGNLQFSPQLSARFTLELPPPGPSGAPAEASIRLEGAISAQGKGPLYEGQFRVPLEGSGNTPGRGYFIATELEPVVRAHVQFWDAASSTSLTGATSPEPPAGELPKSQAPVP